MQQSFEAHTLLRENNVSFKWTVENGSAAKYITEFQSPKFAVPEIDKTCWITVQGTKRDRAVAVILEKCEELKNADVELCGINSDNKEVSFNFFINMTKYGYPYYTISHLDLVSHTVIWYHVHSYCSENNLLRFVLKIKYTTYSSDLIQQYNKSMVLSGYDKLYNNQELCDIQFLIGKEHFKAHSLTLAASSSYFRTMFNHKNFIENRTRVVDLSKDSDITLENFRGLLDFIYGCKSIDELSNIVYQLLILADKFDIIQLHEACEFYLTETINKENVAEILFLSEKYHCKILMKKAIGFAKNHRDSIKNSKYFEDLCKIPDLIKNFV